MLSKPGHYFAAVHEIAERTGLDKMGVARASMRWRARTPPTIRGS